MMRSRIKVVNHAYQTFAIGSEIALQTSFTLVQTASSIQSTCSKMSSFRNGQRTQCRTAGASDGPTSQPSRLIHVEIAPQLEHYRTHAWICRCDSRGRADMYRLSPIAFAPE